tara:strand:- start:4603 stop:5571 length:969 start_codon:yes stop_codon:yes gene_type:complete
MIQKMLMQSCGYTSNVSADIKKQPPELKLNSANYTPDSIYWFRPYLASDYPELTCDKKYIFLYSTDHDSGQGGIYWGKGNNLNLSDFEEVGLIIDGYQAETPFLMRFPQNDRPIHLYYHTTLNDPQNNGHQETKLITTTGGELHTADWTYEGHPLGTFPEDQHTGYLKFWETQAGIIGTHYRKGSNAQTGYIGEWQYSTTVDGLTFQRGEIVNVLDNIEGNRRYVPSFGWFFEMYGKWWYIGSSESSVLPFGAGNETKQLIVAKSNSNLEFKKQLAILNNSQFTRNWEIYIEEEKELAHLYLNEKEDGLFYSTWDLKNLKQL